MRAFFHPDQRRHDPRQFMRVGRIAAPQDLPARIDAFLAELARRGLGVEPPADYGVAPVAAVHHADYLAFLEHAYARWRTLPDAGPEVLPNVFPYWNARPDADRPACPSRHIVAQAGYYLGDLAAPIGPETWRAALAAAHTATAAADAVIGGARAAYALCRPSGHHARADRASGFCYLNNAAIAAERLGTKFARVAVLDVDAHHGDGTQAIFYRRPDVLTVSVHAHPDGYYPFFTGYETERGAGAGEGANLNIPLTPGAGDEAFHAAAAQALKAITAFGADALVVPLGFDGHGEDPIGVLKVTTEGYGGIGAQIGALGLPTVIVQEGGYQTRVLGDCLGRFLDGFGA